MNKPHTDTPRPDLEQLIGDVMERSETDGKSDTEHSSMTDDNNTTTDGEQTAEQTHEQQKAAERVRVSETRDKVTLKTSVKRGTGTRDQDKITVKCKAHDPVAAAQKLQAAIEELEELGVADTLREQGNGDK